MLHYWDWADFEDDTLELAPVAATDLPGEDPADYKPLYQEYPKIASSRTVVA